MNKIYRIYERSPVFLQNVMCSLYGYKENRIRFSKEFINLLDNFIKSDYLNENKIETYKQYKIVKSLKNAKASGLYTELDNVSCKEIDSNPIKVLRSLPILTKDELSERIVNNNYKSIGKKYTKVVTSGTTGKALTLFKDKTSFSAQWAIWFRHRSRFGIYLNDLSVNFTGKPLVPLSQKEGPYWRYNAAQKQYLVSMQHINKNTICEIVGFLNTLSPKFYSGYPSIIAEVSRLSLDAGLILNQESKPKIIFTGAEKLLDYQTASINKWCGVQVTDQYGLTEGNCNFSKCEYDNYHEDFEFCHIELADVTVQKDGTRQGRLIGTSFYNSVMTLIKYDTGDVAILADKNFKCPCGRNSQVILEVNGRIDDFIITTSGRRIMRLDYIFKNTDEVIEAQVIQNEKAKVLIKAVKSSTFLQSSFEKKVFDNFKEYISSNMSIQFEYVSKIEKSPSGKFKAVVNNLGKK